MLFRVLLTFLLLMLQANGTAASGRPNIDFVDASVSRDFLGRFEKVEAIVEQLMTENDKLRLENFNLRNMVNDDRNRLIYAEQDILSLKEESKQARDNFKTYVSGCKCNKKPHNETAEKMVQPLQNVLAIGSEEYELKDVVHQRKLQGGSGTARDKRLLLSLSVPTPTTGAGPGAVYYTARRSSSVPLGSRDILIFDDVLANAGGAYNPSSGIFRAPVSGVYLFSLTGMSFLTNTIHLHIMKNNDVELGKLYAGDGKSTAAAADGGSVTVVAHLDKGEDVMVREKLKHAGYAYGDYYCTFTGVLLS